MAQINNSSSEEQNPQHILQQVEVITDALKWLLIQQVITLNEDEVRQEIAVLEKWMESYRGSLMAANKITKSDVEWLSNLCVCLKSAVEERNRVNSENITLYSPNGDQAQTIDELMKAVHLIHKRIPDIESMFVNSKENDQEQRKKA
jgi:hypothetical protein